MNFKILSIVKNSFSKIILVNYNDFKYSFLLLISIKLSTVNFMTKR
ncbi:hypothetical protein LEP1GSC186_3400 [Leptospira noguchii serovar Autumnalis str. ZUN142]|uniref:Uncharacterized protein n=1 Tax=Leptospira noguchii serovar Autumnalis str. ZUN142 TaxID=1085540 RepID=M6UAH4_9LEPT|nr:hypothetical protein LEP1GSC186_3400 [Leptospira noguchii serovar Autumnalis str. ZUN142]